VPGSAPDAPERIRASAVCVWRGQLLCVRMRDPMSGVARLFPPGGGMEPGEAPSEAAAREALEETGYRVAIDAERMRVARYPYPWNGVTWSITTHFFAAQLLGDPSRAEPVNDTSYNEGVVWLPLEQLDQELSFEPAILASIRALLPAK
jgi:8-oxo-dGTP pyrophosphatase MutT (NUDIX family)